VARRHPIAVAIKQHAGEEALLPSSSAIVVLGSVAGKLGWRAEGNRGLPRSHTAGYLGLEIIAKLAPVLQVEPAVLLRVRSVENAPRR